MAQSIGIHGCMFFFATFCMIGAIFVVIVFPETKGKSHEEIMRALE